MPVFQVKIERKVTKYDEFTRFIEADTREQAEAAAERLAEETEREGCPDDAAETDMPSDLGEWEVGDITEPDEEFDPESVIKADEVGQ